MRIAISPTLSQVTPETGIGRVVMKQYEHLQALGHQIVDPVTADICVCHVAKSSMPRVDVLHSHGLYFSDIPHAEYSAWHHRANKEIISAVREAVAVTVPSPWVARAFQRDMRLQPDVIGHGVDCQDWSPGENGGYILWNKNRNTDVCDPTPALELARRGLTVVATFLPLGIKEDLSNLKVIGPQSFEAMKELVRNADIYLGTTPETFGIGTLEALACGVPVLGYSWCGTGDLIQHGVNGYLVAPGDVDGLISGVDQIRAMRNHLSNSARATAEKYTWAAAMKKYAEVYERVFQQLSSPVRAGCVITNYNYAQFVGQAIESIHKQSVSFDRLVVVDDGSTDNSRDIIDGFPTVEKIYRENRGVAQSRNDGVRFLSDCQLILCLDADDMLDTQYLKVVKPFMVEDRSLGVAYTGLRLMRDDGGTSVGDWPPEFDWSIQAEPHVPPSNCIPSGSLFRRTMWERAGGWKQVYAPGEDTEFWTRGLSVGFNARRVNKEPLFHYRAHEGSQSRIKKYSPIDTWHPWMRDHKYPMGAPTKEAPTVRSYNLPAISVIIPVGPGHEQYLRGAIDSLLGQTFRNWEVVVINDTGNGAALDEIKANYPFMIIETTSGSRGAGYGRNLGMRKAHGELVFFLDSDDYLDPNALDKMIRRWMDEKGERYVYSDWVAVRKDGTATTVATRDYDPFEMVNRPENGHGISVLIARRLAMRVRFDESLSSFEDVDFFMRCATMGVWGVRLPEPLLLYRVDLGQRRPKDADGIAKISEAVKERYKLYANGEKQMSSCCGGNADEFLRIKKLATEDWPQVQAPDPGTPGLVRMEFIGETVGAQTYTVHGHGYRGGNNAINKYVDVDPADVAGLELTSKWRRVNMPVQNFQPPAQRSATISTPVMDAPKELEETMEEKRAKAEKAIADAKAEAPAVDLPVVKAPKPELPPRPRKRK